MKTANYDQCPLCKKIRLTNGQQHGGWMVPARLEAIKDKYELVLNKHVHCSTCTTVKVQILL